ncbi:LysR family transcriptional regulator [Rhodocyclus tenuis]|uniref:DNA-binding transcriptional LysR family regulator n=1 Tax=Rhodocyclus tenuis TaxID=1066 RepID=A0A840G6D0_RHOTE|nr:LysR family transcriptional regulator [Rhodocyclus tenuis]MBB4246951.1 DNA-binding transcriptional LysR family regulator [Rhodocyclus tenuis]
MPINELRAMEIFAKAVELGSLRKAAAAQGMSPQAASQALSQLEQRLGVRLLHRTTRSISPTDEGQQLLEATQPALAMLERALQRVRSAKDEIAGPLHIAAPRSGFVPVIWPVLNAFCEQYPEIQPDLHLDDHISNWVLERADVGFRIGAPPEEGLIARKLFPIQLIICASPAYLERHGLPLRLEDLAAHRCSVFRHPATGKVYPWYVKVDGELVSRDLPPAISTNDIELELRAVLDGQAIGQLSAISAAPHIRAGRLRPLLLQHMTDHMGVYLYYGSRRAQPARVRRFIEFALDRLGNQSEFVLNEPELQANQ